MLKSELGALIACAFGAVDGPGFVPVGTIFFGTVDVPVGPLAFAVVEELLTAVSPGKGETLRTGVETEDPLS